MPSNKKKSRKNKGKERSGSADNSGSAASSSSSAVALQSASAANGPSEADLKVAALARALHGVKMPSSSANAEKPKGHKFWDTQPVPKMNEAVKTEGMVDRAKTVEEVRQTPYNLPKGFKWVSLDVHSKEEMTEVYELLTNNYVEDDDNMFRFDYSREFLEWALQPPGYHSDWHVGIRQESNNRLLAFITGVPATVRVKSNSLPMTEINFLCVHKKLRSKRLAPVLIKEITRRVNLKNVWQAVYTAGVELPKPVAKCRYFHRSLNPKKLCDVQFSALPAKMTMKRLIQRYKLPAEPIIPGVRPFAKADVPAVHKLLTSHLENFKLRIFFDEEEVAHWLLPRKGVIDAFVVENPETKEITDFISFYHLPSSIIGHEKYKTLYAAYSFYNVATSVPFKDLMYNALILANQLKLDVFNALNLLDNGPVLLDLKFGPGDGYLQYYLYNWKIPQLEAEEVGIVLL